MSVIEEVAVAIQESLEVAGQDVQGLLAGDDVEALEGEDCILAEKLLGALEACATAFSKALDGYRLSQGHPAGA